MLKAVPQRIFLTSYKKKDVITVVFYFIFFSNIIFNKSCHYLMNTDVIVCFL